MKKIQRIIISSVLVGTLVVPATQVFAAESKETPRIQQSNKEEGPQRSQTGPAYYEYKDLTGRFYKMDLAALQGAAEEAIEQNTVASYVNMASILTALVYPSASAPLSRVSAMMKSELDPAKTLLFTSKSFAYMLDNPQCSSVTAKMKYKRLFNGITMLEWYPIGSPVYVSYNNN